VLHGTIAVMTMDGITMAAATTIIDFLSINFLPTI